MSTDTTISVSSTLLRRHLTAVLPHVGVDDTLPALASVRVEIRAGYLYLAATDRYTMGVTRLRIPGEPAADYATLLASEYSQEMRRLLKKADEVAALTFSDGHMAVDAGRNRTATWGAEDKWVFPEWRPMLARMLAADPVEMGDSHGLDPAFLARFCAGTALDPLSIRVTNSRNRQTGEEPPDPAPMLLVTRGDWFIGCLVPARLVTLNADAATVTPWDAWACLPAETRVAAAL